MSVKTDLRSHSIFKTLTDNELSLLLKSVKKITCKKDEIIIQENDLSEEMYFILNGKVSLVKQAPDFSSSFVIGELHKHDIFGEVGFFNNNPRSCSIVAAEQTDLLVIYKDNAASLYQKVIKKLSNNIHSLLTERLVSSNENLAISLAREEKLLKLRNEFASFFIFFMIIVVVNILTTGVAAGIIGAKSLMQWAGPTNIIIMLIGNVYLTYKFSLPFHIFGVTLKNWKKSLTEGIIIGSIISAIIIFLSYYTPTAVMHPFSFLFINEHYVFAILYFFSVLIQEFVARGVVQTSLKRFLDDKNGIITVLLISLMFGAFHLSSGIKVIIVTFLGSIIFGLLYLRHKSLLGVSVCHYVMGIIAKCTGLI